MAEIISMVGSGETLTAFAGLIISLIIIYIVYRFISPLLNFLEVSYNKETKISLLEEHYLDELAQERGVDLEKKMLEKAIYGKKSFRKKVEEEMYSKMFPEKEETKEK